MSDKSDDELKNFQKSSKIARTPTRKKENPKNFTQKTLVISNSPSSANSSRSSILDSPTHIEKHTESKKSTETIKSTINVSSQTTKFTSYNSFSDSHLNRLENLENWSFHL